MGDVVKVLGRCKGVSKVSLVGDVVTLSESQSWYNRL